MADAEQTQVVSKDPFARIAERQTWITATAEQTVQKAVMSTVDALGGDPLRRALNGEWLHEPVHAVLTDVPIGAWTATIAFDAVGALTGSSNLDTAADATVAVGLLGALGAAVTGLNDWSEVDDPTTRKIGAVHGLLNVTATGLFIASSVARCCKSRSAGRALAVLGYLLVSASAHLGGNLVYEHGMGVASADKGK